MKKLISVIVLSILQVTSVSDNVVEQPTQNVATQNEPQDLPAHLPKDSLFNEAVKIIKHYETWHYPKHYPYIGYGHMILKGDSNLVLPITRCQGDSILRKDLLQKMSVFKLPFPEKLLLGMLAYNVGEYKIIHPNKSSKTRLSKAIYDRQCIDSVFVHYISFCHYNVSKHALLEKRRIEEFELMRMYLGGE